MNRYSVNNKPVYENGYIIDRSDNSIVYISIYGFNENIKSLLAFFNGKRKIQVDNKIKFLTANAYNCITEHSDEDTMHVIFYKKDPYQCSRIDSSNSFYIYLDKNFVNKYFGSINIASILSDKNISEIVYNQFYEKFKKNITVPIIKEWIPYIIDKFEKYNFNGGYSNECYIRTLRSINSSGSYTILALKVNICFEEITAIISNGLKNHSILLGDKPAKDNDTETDIKSLDEYLSKYSSQLMNKVQNSFTPIFDSKTEKFDTKVESFSNYVSYRSNKKLFNAQKSVINATARNIRKNRSTIIVGQMGSGITNLSK